MFVALVCYTTVGQLVFNVARVEHIPRVEQSVILRQSACKVVDIDIGSRDVTVTHVGADVRSTHVKEVWTQSSDRIFTNIGDALVQCGTKQHCADQLVAVEDEARNYPCRRQLVPSRLLRQRPTQTTFVKVFHDNDLKQSEKFSGNAASI